MLNQYLLGDHSSETDPYYPLLVDDLLKGLNDWKNVQDIIRLTFKALSDVVRVQGEAIRDLERASQTKVSRTELTSALAGKVNAADLGRELSDLLAALDSKPSTEDLRSALEDKVSKSELQYQLSAKVSVDEVKSLMDHKTNLKEFENESEVIRYQLQQLQKDYVARLQTLPTQKDLQLLRQTLDSKASSTEVLEALEAKANKQAVANALQRKANKSDVDAVLSRKPDVTDLQELASALESKADIVTVERLMQAIDDKVDRADLDVILQSENEQRPGQLELDSLASAIVGLRKEVDSKLQESSKEGQNRISSALDALDHDIKVIHEILETKADVHDFERLNQVLGRKADSEGVANTFGTLKHEHEIAVSAVELDFQNEVKRIDEHFSELAAKLEIDTHRLTYELEKVSESLQVFEDSIKAEMDESVKIVHSITASAKNELGEEIATLKLHMEKSISLIDELSKRKADRREATELKADLTKGLESLSQMSDLQQGITGLRKEVAKAIAEVTQECRELVQRQERDLVSLIQQKASLVEVQGLVNDKADLNTLNRALGNRVSTEQLQEFASLLEQLNTEIRKKANLNDFEAFGRHARSSLEDLGKSVLLKANIADVMSLLDQKAPADSTHKLLQQILEELDSKAASTDIRQFIQDQKEINQTLCAENCVGRWIWKSGEVRNGYSVPWEVQTVNTFPDNFLWDLEKTSILCVAPGLYEVAFGFYCRRSPVVQLLVNGEPIFTAGGPKDQGSRQLLRHSAGNVGGLTGVDYVALPARARVSFLFTGDAGGEGFMSLRKL